jgi:hypothetical protein
MKWKYVKDQQKRTNDLFLYLPEGKEKKVVITGWSFEKMFNGALFKCEVINEDGQEVDKFWSVWDHELKEMLKSKLKGKKPDKTKVALTVKKTTVEGDESYELQ